MQQRRAARYDADSFEHLIVQLTQGWADLSAATSLHSEPTPDSSVSASCGCLSPAQLDPSASMYHIVLCLSRQVDLVLLPAVTGDFGAMPGHVPTVAQLRPGVVTVHKELDKTVDKYFVSSG